MAEPLCKENMNLDLLSVNYFDYLLHSELLLPWQLNWSSICAEDAGELWLRLLSNYRFCNPNHILSERHGCVCRHDRECHEKQPSEFSLSSSAKLFFIISMVTLVAYVGLSMLKELRSLGKTSREPIRAKLLGKL
jgi:hypothetical protein